MRLRSALFYILPGTALAVLLALLPGCKPEELGAAHPTTNEFYDPPGTLVVEPRMFLAPKSQDAAAAQAKSASCLKCHKGIDNVSMHTSAAVKLGCTDCHGGNANCDIKELAHVQPRGHWYSQTPSSTPPRKRLPGQPPLEEKKVEEKKADATEKKEPTALSNRVQAEAAIAIFAGVEPRKAGQKDGTLIDTSA